MHSTRFLPIVTGALGLAVALTGCSKEFSQKDVDRSRITLAEVRALVETNEPGVVLLADARGPKAYAAGHIPLARNYATSRFSGKYGETDPALEAFDTIVVYGDNPGSGSHSALALDMMSTGYKNVRTFFDGFDAWKRAGLPVETLEAGAAPEEPKKPN